MCKQIATAVALTALLLGLPGTWAQPPVPQGRPTAKAAIGIGFEPTGPGVEPSGLIVRQVLPGQPAAKAGLEVGDVITRVGKQKIDSASSLAKVMANHRPGQKVTLHVIRNGKERTMSIRLGEPLTRLPAGEEGAIPQQPSGAFLGVQAVTVNELPEAMRLRYNLKATEGLVIVEVLANSPAARAGLRPGDVIESVNGKQAANIEALRNAVRTAGIGKKLRMEVQRGEEKLKMTANLGRAPSAGINILPIPTPPVPGINNQLVQPPILQAAAAQRNAALERRIADLEKRVRDLEKRLKEAQK